ncbi:hypothetical protein LAWI1_G007880, partial [Lachnellula willkommii]
NHPAFNCYAPTDAWPSKDPKQRELERPRVIIYTRKGAGLKINVNSILILNAYRTLNTLEVINYVMHLTPLAKCLVSRDFNSRHDMFEPGITTALRGQELAD